MNKLDEDYSTLLKDIIENGIERNNTRTGRVLSVFGRFIRHNMADGFPLITTKKMAWKQIVTELLWFLRGDTNIRYLLDNNCHIWDGDAYKKYCKLTETVKEPDFDIHVDDPKEGKVRILSKKEFIDRIKTDDAFAKQWGNLGPIYGHQWRDWNLLTWENDIWILAGIDQIKTLIDDIKTNPESRRLMVNAWNVSELHEMTLPPCHYGFQVYVKAFSAEERKKMYLTGKYSDEVKEYGLEDNHIWLDTWSTVPRGKLSLMWNQRSVDTALGWPFNVASYGLLLLMLAKQTHMIPDELICNLGDVHLYANHIDNVKVQLQRWSRTLPKVTISDRKVDDISEYTHDDITLSGYDPHDAIKFTLSN